MVMDMVVRELCGPEGLEFPVFGLFFLQYSG